MILRKGEFAKLLIVVLYKLSYAIKLSVYIITRY